MCKKKYHLLKIKTLFSIFNGNRMEAKTKPVKQSDGIYIFIKLINLNTKGEKKRASNEQKEFLVAFFMENRDASNFSSLV